MIKSSFYNLAFLLLAFALVGLSCDSKAQKHQNPEDEILQLNKELLDSAQHIIKANAQKYIRLTQEFVTTKADSTKIIKYVIQGAEVAVNIGEFEKALQSYELLIHQFPNNPKVIANALFAQAFILENHTKDLQGAEKLYRMIQQKYPDLEITKTVKATLENLGKSDAELLEMIRNKNK